MTMLLNATNACTRWLGLAIVFGLVLLSIALADEETPQGRDSTPSSPTSRFDPGWRPVAAKNGEVRRLTAHPQRWTPKSMSDLDDLDSLEYLNLSGTSAGDEELQSLVRHANLKTLLLARTKVSDAGMAHLARFSELETLDLSDTQVSDAGLQHFRELRKLKSLVTHHSRVTDRGLESLESIRPDFEAIRLWDVTWEEFDHAILLRTPRFDLIMDFPLTPARAKKADQLQISGPRWGKRRPGCWASVNGSRATPTLSITCIAEAGDEAVTSVITKATDPSGTSVVHTAISSIRIGRSTLKIADPAKTYFVDGQGKIVEAPITLRFDESRIMWVESSSEQASDARSRDDPLPKSLSPGASYTVKGSDNDRTPTACTSIYGDWNGKLVRGFIDSACIPPYFGVTSTSGGPAPIRPENPKLSRQSNAGIILVFLHVPAGPGVYGNWQGGGTFGAWNLRGHTPFAWDRIMCDPATGGEQITSWFRPSCLIVCNDYRSSGADRETAMFGSSCSVTAALARGLSTYWFDGREAASTREQHPFSDWPNVHIEKHGKELVIPVSRDRVEKRVELVDLLGRKCVVEEQRIDLTGPKKTMVLDVYGRLRVLEPKDAERILRTRVRDYLDQGDPSPAGPVAFVRDPKEPARETKTPKKK
jgi:hypothetical protein